jgi:DNA (cytosine-5)-methyltransferase 1
MVLCVKSTQSSPQSILRRDRVIVNKLSLFSGIGGDDLASEWAGIKTIYFVEKDKFCQKVLRKHWPGIPIIEDVKDVTRERIVAYSHKPRLVGGQTDNERAESQYIHGATVRDNSSTEIGTDSGIDIISGGFPCQPHSVAGKRKGSSDERNLWPEFRRIISEIKPRWVLAENVPGLFSSDAGRFFGGVLSDLAALGYSVGWCTFGAVDVGALHRRDRVFIVAHAGLQHGDLQQRTIRAEFERGRESLAYPAIKGLEGAESTGKPCTGGLLAKCGTVSDTASRCEQSSHSQCDVGRLQDETMRTIWNQDYWAVEPNVGRVAHGVSHRVDRLKGLGNAVVPQQIYLVYKAIVEVEKQGVIL